jgi:outer membrane receptor protein involved in Fe transport
MRCADFFPNSPIRVAFRRNSSIALIAITALCSTAPTTALGAQRVGPGAGRPTSPLDRKVTIRIERTTIAKALDDLRRQTGVFVGYNAEQLAADTTQVSYSGRDVPLSEAIDSLLASTRFELHQPAPDQLVVRLRPQTEAAAPALRVVTGIITDARGKLPIAGAAISIGDAGIGGRTGSDGRFRIGGVPIGSHSVLIRRLGYSAATVLLDVAQSGEAKLEKALEPLAGTLGRVLVTGDLHSGDPTPGQALPFSISAMSSSDLDRLHLTRLDQVFRYLIPGAFAWDMGAGSIGNAVSVRGAGSGTHTTAPVRIYVDNIQVADDYMTTLDLGSVDRIEFVRGPLAAVLYGSGAAGGALRITTKRGEYSPTPRAFVTGRSELGVLNGSSDAWMALQQRYAFSSDGSVGRISYQAGGSFSRVGETRWSSSVAHPSAYAAVRYSKGSITADLSARYLTSLLGKNVGPYFVVPNDTNPWHGATSRFENAALTGSFAYTSGEWRHEISAGVNSNDYFSRSTGSVAPAKDAPILSWHPQDRLNITYRGVTIRELSDGVSAGIALGAEHSARHARSRMELTGNSEPARARYEALYGEYDDPVNGYSAVSGAFVHGVLSFSERLFTSVGARLENTRALERSYGTQLMPTADVTLGPVSIGVPMRFWVAYGSATSIATFNPASVTRSNFDLRMERRSGFEGGVAASVTENARIEVTAYDQRALDAAEYVILDPTADPIVGEYQNLGTVTNRGVEVSAVADWSRVQVRAHYNYSHTMVRTVDLAYDGAMRVGDPMRSVPAHTAAGVAAIDISPRTSATIGATWVGGWLNEDWLAMQKVIWGTAPYSGSQRDYLMRYRGFAKAKLVVERGISPSLTAFGYVDNIPIKQGFELYNSWSVPPRTIAAGVRYGR